MKRIFLWILVGFTLFSSCKSPKKSNYVKLKGNVFGTTYGISYQTEIDYKKQFDSLFTAVNKSLSTYIPTSDISKINKGDSTVTIDKYFIEVMKKSKRIYSETDGYFDPTVGNLVNAWGFGPTKEINDLDSTQVKNMIQLVGFDKVSIENNRIKKEREGIYLDFNSIAKGYGIDVIARFLERKNVNNYLIEIGGEIRAKGKNQNGKLWQIQLQNPVDLETNKGIDYLELDNVSMATSGNYRKYRIAKNGRKFVHTINPKTGFATESNLLSASVIAPIDCADVDAYATAFMAMGLEKTKAFVQKYPYIKVILIYENNKGQLTKYRN